MATIKLLHMHKKLADRWLVTGNMTQSAKDVGYQGKNVHVTASKVLKRPEVALYIANKTAELSASAETAQQRVISELEAMAFANITDFIRVDSEGLPQVDFSSATPEQLRAITSVASKRRVTTDKDGRVTEDVESKFAMADKYRGLELLGRHMGLFKADEQRVVIDVADRLLAARQRFKQIESQGGGGAGV